MTSTLTVMSHRSSSRTSTPPSSTRSRPSPNPPRSPLGSSPAPSPDLPQKLNFTVYGAPAPFTSLRSRASKASRPPRPAPTPPASPEATEKTSITTEDQERQLEYEELSTLECVSPKSPPSTFNDIRPVPPLDLSSLQEEDDDDDVVQSGAGQPPTGTSNDLSKSTTIDIATGRSETSTTSSLAPLSDCSTQTCTSLPRDEFTHRSQATLHDDDVSEGGGSTSGHRRYIIERLESGYFSPDTVDVRFSVSEVMEAADYANRLAELLDQALGRELGYDPLDGDHSRTASISRSLAPLQESKDAVSLLEEDRNNGGGLSTIQNVIHRIQLFESGHRVHVPDNANGRVTRYFRGGVTVNKEDVGMPIPPPLPYEGFKTVHDGRCFCCGPRLFQFSADDLQRQRSLLKKVPERDKEEKREESANMDLQNILKNVISKRRDVVRPIEEPHLSVRSDWSENEACAQVD